MIDDFGSLIPSVQQEITAHLEMSKVYFDGYFLAGELNISEQWIIIINPFIFNINQMADDDDLQEDLIDLKENQAMKLQFDANDLENFWCVVIPLYQKLGTKALSILVPFATTYLCESDFSSILYLKNKYRNRLNPAHDLRVAVSNKVPRFETIIS